MTIVGQTHKNGDQPVILYNRAAILVVTVSNKRDGTEKHI